MSGQTDESQVSWKAVDEDAVVVAGDGREIGRLREVVGDEEADIFDGLVVAVPKLEHDRFIAAERVRRIWPDRVEVDLGPEEVLNLPPYTEPAVVEWHAGERGSFGVRLRAAMRDLFGR